MGFRRKIDLPVIRRPNLPSMSLVNPFHPKPSVMVPQDQPHSSSSSGGGSVLENDNYHQFVRQSEAVFSLGEDSEASSSSSSTPSPRDPSEPASDHLPDVRRSGPGAILDRLKSGVVNTRGFERF